MEEFSLAEADFQQYYGIDLDEYYKTKLAKGKGFYRYARLFSELPPTSRCIMKLSPIESWDFKQDVLSRQLYELRSIATILYNTNRPKGSKAAKVGEPFEPDYVTQARKDYEEWQKTKQEKDIDNDTRDFWQKRSGIDML